MSSDVEGVRGETNVIVKGTAPDLRIPADECVAAGPVDPCVIVIFGATGDLTTRKLAPELYRLYVSGGMPERFLIVAAARSDLDHDQFRERIRNSLSEPGMSRWDEFASRIFYQQVRFDSSQSFHALAETLGSLDKEHNTGGNRIFYFAVPPSLYKITAQMLGQAGLSREREDRSGWSRLVVEKPFGHDLKSAIELNQALHEHFQEHQIFRIDHYLAKETVQNVLTFRFANAIFEPLWNRTSIDSVHITSAESLGVVNRAAYYEEAGVIRDMLQNHMMQLLAVTAMEPPSRFDADSVRDEKVKVFRSLRPIPLDRWDKILVLGQYGPGVVDGTMAPGYRDAPGVSPDSTTPTFAAMTAFVDNWRWQGVPFHITSGKGLAKKVTRISIHFKRAPLTMFRGTLDEEATPNVLTLEIYPEEKISLTFQTKNPGAAMCLRSVTMDFNYSESYSGPKLDPYGKAIVDCMQGDRMLFWRQDAVELCWAFFTPVLEDYENRENKEKRLLGYDAGTWGPDAAKLSK